MNKNHISNKIIKKNNIKKSLYFEKNINIDKLYESRKQVIKNNYWNKEHEYILESLQVSSLKLVKAYKMAYFQLKSRLQWYRIPIIIISAIGGFLSISNSGYIPPKYNKWISLFVGFANLLVTIISLIENFKKIDVNVNGCFEAYINFQKLHDEISIIKRIPPEERENNGHETINKLFTRYENYLIKAPVLQKILKDYLGNNILSDLLSGTTESWSTDNISSDSFNNFNSNFNGNFNNDVDDNIGDNINDSINIDDDINKSNDFFDIEQPQSSIRNSLTKNSELVDVNSYVTKDIKSLGKKKYSDTLNVYENIVSEIKNINDKNTNITNNTDSIKILGIKKKILEEIKNNFDEYQIIKEDNDVQDIIPDD